MVSQSTKRKLPSTAAPSAKRNKTSATAKPGAKGRPTDNKTTKKARRSVDAGALAWKSVGLEVIEGVDVVRQGGKVQFVVPAEREANADSDKNETDDQEDAGESFEGFSDGPVEGGNVDTDEDGHRQGGVEDNGAEAKPAGKEKKKQQKKKNDDKQDDKLAATAASNKVPKSASQQGNSFNALAAMVDAEEDEDVDVAAWVPLNLSPNMLTAIAKLKFAKPTLIQEKTIPEIVAGEDVIGKAQTGSGKTLAFGIPMVEKWLELYDGQEEVQRKGPMAVVLSPTRELAKQLGDHLKALCNGLPTAPYVCVVTGGLSIQKQQRQLEKADIVIGTPGRLWEVLDGDLKLQDAFTKIRFLVVDEADRLFKAGQFKEAEDIIGALDKKTPESYDEDDEDEEEKPDRQTLVFSATFDKNLQTKLAGKGKNAKSVEGSDEEKMEYLMKCLKFRREPKFIDANPVSQMAEGLKEGLIECGAMEKDLYLYAVLLLNPGRRTLIFTNSISAVRRLTPLLQNLNLTVLPLHSQMAQKARLRSLERFTAANNSILVATDVAARGLDIKNVDQVLHYHVPRSADTYIHRSGRTARGAGTTGVSVMLCSPDEVIPTRRLAAKVHAEQRRGRQHAIQTLPLDRQIAARLKPRVELAKRIADSILAKEKAHSDSSWLRSTADELGVEYDSDEFDETAGTRGGRGGGRKRKEKEALSLSKAEMGALKAKLREELSRRVNLGVSERYITGGRVNVGALLKERENASVGGVFLGGEGLGLDL
jgi:ATP-dependent RNA helicase DDX24/MAK5